MSDERAPVAVVVVAWNAQRYLADCLDSVLAQKPAPAEVVVVDNASADGTAGLLRERFPSVRTIPQETNVGFCKANNDGIRSTRSPFVLVLNPDTVLRPDFVATLLPAFDDPRVGIAGGKLLRFDGRTLDSAGQRLARSRRPVDRGYGRPDEGAFDRDEEVFGICGAAALYRRAMLDSIADPGGICFDERFFAFFEDLDLAWRARRAGWRAVYRHRAVALHARGGSADAASFLDRWAAMLRRRPEVRYHVVKNRYLSILRNDSARDYLRDLPFIWSRDIATLLLLGVTSPGVLGRLWRGRAVFRDAWVRRRLDGRAGGHHVGPGMPPEPPARGGA